MPKVTLADAQNTYQEALKVIEQLISEANKIRDMLKNEIEGKVHDMTNFIAELHKNNENIYHNMNKFSQLRSNLREMNTQLFIDSYKSPKSQAEIDAISKLTNNSNELNNLFKDVKSHASKQRVQATAKELFFTHGDNYKSALNAIPSRQMSIVEKNQIKKEIQLLQLNKINAPTETPRFKR